MKDATKRSKRIDTGLVAGILIALATFACLAFRVIEPRLGLLTGAMAMFLIARSPATWFRKFVETMGRTEFLKVILPVFAFTSVAKVTGCTDAFVNILASPLSSWGSLLVPVAVLVAFLTNMALVSATASGLAVAGVFLPILIAAGIDPTLAAASILVGTWGAVLSPGSKHAAIIAQAANNPQSDEDDAAQAAKPSQTDKEDAVRVEAMDVVRGHAAVVVLVLAIVMALMWLETAMLPGARVSVARETGGPIPAAAWAPALVPLIPLILLWTLPIILKGRLAHWFPSDLLVIQTMFIGIVVAAFVGARRLVEMPDPKTQITAAPGTTLAEAIFSGNGMAYAYGNVMTIIISAMVFVAGLDELGVLDGFLSLLKRRRRSAAWFAVFGNMGFAALSGSGDAASCSFNLGVTPFANDLGERPRELGSMAWLGAEMGRCFSPVAAVTLSIAANASIAVSSSVVKWTVAPITLGGLAAVLLRRNVKD